METGMNNLPRTLSLWLRACIISIYWRNCAYSNLSLRYVYTRKSFNSHKGFPM